MYPATESEAKVVCKESLFVDDNEDVFFMTVFIRQAPIEENNASECIRTVTATYGCKIAQSYEYEANEFGYEANYSTVHVYYAARTDILHVSFAVRFVSALSRFLFVQS